MLSKWCKTTSLDGAIDLYQSRSSKPQLLFWTFAMLTMISCWIYFTYKAVEDYIKYPTHTLIRARQSSDMHLPEVLICFNGGLNVDAMMQAEFTIEFISNFIGSIKHALRDEAVLESADKEIKEYMKRNNINMKKFLQNFSYSCVDILGKPLNDRQPSCNNSSPLYSHTFGQCHVIRSNRKQYYPGIDGGIQITLKTPPSSFYEFSPELATGYGLSNSFYVSLDKKFIWITRRFLLMPVNVRAEVTLYPTRYLRLASNDPCDNGSNIYSSNTCFHRCYAEALYQYCGCYALEYLDFSEEFDYSDICTPTEVRCTSYHELLAQPCQQKCRPKCDEWVYDSTMTYAFLEPKPINQSYSILSIGYSAMEYKQVAEVDTFTLQNGLADLGGQAGLWLGVSIVTIIQALYYIVLTIYRKVFGIVIIKTIAQNDDVKLNGGQLLQLSETGASAAKLVKY